MEPFSYMVGIFLQTGLATNNGNGVSALSWQELEAFMRCTHIPLSNWESDTLRRMSANYASAVVRYNDQNVEAPYQSEEDKQAFADEVKSALRNVQVKEKYGFSQNKD